MIGSEHDESGVGERIILKDILYESRFFIVNFLGIVGLTWIFYELITGLGRPHQLLCGVTMLVVCLFNCYWRMFFVTGFRHRYFSHRSFKNKVPRWLKGLIRTSRQEELYLRSVQFIEAFLATADAQKGVIWWASHHRHHHKFSDTADDLHSFDFVRKETGSFWKGFYHSHVKWVLLKKYKKADYDKVPDLKRFPELMFFEKARGYLIAPVLLAVTCFFLGIATGVGGWSMLFGGFFASTLLTYHFTFFINSLAHMMGTARFDTGEESKNCGWLNWFTLGEGWHNNHHHKDIAASQAILPEEERSDITYQILLLLEKMDLIKIAYKYTDRDIAEARKADDLSRQKKHPALVSVGNPVDLSLRRDGTPPVSSGPDFQAFRAFGEPIP
jgi:stearoyl-CoA desaturase (delta-9 desaturase)